MSAANILTSLLSFISTNIDDIFILMLLFGAQHGKLSNIVLGQYLGIGFLVVVSLIGAYLGSLVDQRYVGLLGLFPILLALKQIVGLLRHNVESDNNITLPAISILSVAGITIANGADNLGVYIPLLTTMSQPEKIQLVVVFIIMTYVWCIIAKNLASHPLIARQLEKYGHILMPLVLFFLGIFILFESNTFSLFAQ